MQMTIRDVPADVRQKLNAEAKAKGVSLNQAAIDAMAKGVGVSPAGQPKRDLSDIAFSMTAADARAVLTMTAEADAADVKAQKKGSRDARRSRH